MRDAPDAIGAAEAELCRLMSGYLDGHIDAFDRLYAVLAPKVRGYSAAMNG
jgi:hypothetical protein